MSPKEMSQSVLEGSFYFDPQDGIYEDHFPSFPVVPGSLIIQSFVNIVSHSSGIDSFRFLSFVAPGHYTYRLEERAKKWDCFLFHGEQVIAQGILRR
jgi:3-hydroxyacyl-[acyl-carrier-protein] dehydratase